MFQINPEATILALQKKAGVLVAGRLPVGHLRAVVVAGHVQGVQVDPENGRGSFIIHLVSYSKTKFKSKSKMLYLKKLSHGIFR